MHLAFLCVCVHACGVHVYGRACIRACVRTCVRTCMRLLVVRLSGVNFKASVQKKEKSRGFEFVPTNLHVQRMKVLDLDGQGMVAADNLL